MRRLLAGVLTGALVGSALAQPGASSAPPAAPPTTGAAGVERAKELYTVARKALDDGRHDDAIRDFGAAYEITKDPVMFYWIGYAHAQAGKCDVALIYYGRYLKEGQPAGAFLETVRQRVTACGGGPADAAGSAAEPPAPPAGTGSGSASEPTVAGSAAEPPAPPPPAPLRAKHQGPWLLVGGSIAMLTVGVVLAYAAEASENDVADLYVGLEGNPPAFDTRTQERYDDLVAEGERNQRLSWASFALAGGLAAGAAIWYFAGRDEADPVITPTLTPGGAGAAATIRW